MMLLCVSSERTVTNYIPDKSHLPRSYSSKSVNISVLVCYVYHICLSLCWMCHNPMILITRHSRTVNFLDKFINCSEEDCIYHFIIILCLYVDYYKTSWVLVNCCGVCNCIQRKYDGADVILNLDDVRAQKGVTIVNILH